MTTTITWRTDEPPLALNERCLVYVGWLGQVEIACYGGTYNGTMRFSSDRDYHMTLGNDVAAWAELPEPPQVQPECNDKQIEKEHST